MRADAIVLALALEADGHAMTAQAGTLHVTNGRALSAERQADIRRLRRHLLAIAGYVVPE